MMHSLDKQNIFDFFKAESFIQEISEDKIIIEENNKSAKLKKIIIRLLDNKSKYWIIDTESNAFQLQGKKVENIILEQTADDILNIIMVELKSEQVGNQNKILDKFRNSLSFIYILLHLLEGKSKQKINIFGILVAQKEMNWNKREHLNIFASTRLRYTKRSFFTANSEVEIKFSDIVQNDVNI